MALKNRRDLELEERVRSIVAKLIGEEVYQAVRETITEQLALRFGALPDARKARAAIRTFRPDWSRRRGWPEANDNTKPPAESRGREEVNRFSPPKLVR
jgi:hypothetical protein